MNFKEMIDDNIDAAEVTERLLQEENENGTHN